MLSVSEKINEGVRIKTQGNEYFAAKRYKKAIVTYNTVFAYIKGLGNAGDAMSQYSNALNITLPTANEQQAIAELSVNCYSNIANCYLKLNDMEKSIEYSTKAINIDDKHLKSIFRKGQALLQLKYFDESKTCLEAALRLNPDNNAIKRELQKLQIIIRRRDEKNNQKLAKALQDGF